MRPAGLLDEVLDHLFRHLKVADHAIRQRPIGADIVRRPAHQHLGFSANRADIDSIGCINGHDRRFVDNNSCPGT
jgi:hypothetical protein